MKVTFGRFALLRRFHMRLVLQMAAALVVAQVAAQEPTYVSALTAGHCHNACDSVRASRDLIRALREGPKPVLVEEYRNSLRVLVGITGWMSRSEFSSTVGYRGEHADEEYDEDMRMWALWLEVHDCGR